jgi:hypothetical protein
VAKILKEEGEDHLMEIISPWSHGIKIVLDISLGYSWGYCMEGKVAFEDGGLQFAGEGMSKSWRILEAIGSKGYDTYLDIKSKKDVDPKSFPVNQVVIDNSKWEATIGFKDKQVA